MRHLNLYLCLFSAWLIFPSLSHTRRISLDDVTNGSIVKRDDVERSFINSFLVEKHVDAQKKGVGAQDIFVGKCACANESRRRGFVVTGSCRVAKAAQSARYII